MTNDGLHHSQVLEVIVRLEKRIACVEFHQDASDAPDIAWIRPAQAQDDLRCSVVPGANNRRVILILECCRAEIDETDLSVQKNSPLGRRATDSC